MNIKVDINVCRVCLKSKNGKSLFIDSTITEKFQFSTLIKIKRNDGLPTMICEKCEVRLKIAYEFKKQAVVSDAHLRAFIDRVNNQFKEVTRIDDYDKNDENEEEIKLLMEAGYKPTETSTSSVTLLHNSGNSHENDTEIIQQNYLQQQHQQEHQQQHYEQQEQQQIVTVEVTDYNGLIQEDCSTQEYDENIHQIDNYHDIGDDNDGIEDDDIDDEQNEECDEDVNDDENDDENKFRNTIKIEDNKNTMEGQIVTITDNSIVDRGLVSVEVPVEFIVNEFPPITDASQTSNVVVNVTEMTTTTIDTITTTNSITTGTTTTLCSDPLETSRIDKPGHENRSNICIKCDRDFSTKTNLIRHMMTHDGVKPFQCNICGNGFTQNGSLKQHMLIHTGERPYKCHVCNRGFTQGKSLVFHMRRHTGEKPYACDKCGLTFRQKDGMKRHVLMKHTGAATEVHICSICSRILQSKYSLQVHMKKHLLQPSSLHRCDVCEKNFSTKGSLTIHQRQHTGEKPFKCEYCNKKFPRRSSLMTHTKVHLDEKPYKCGQCNKGFTQKNLLIAHINNIHNNKPVKAFQCGKCFKSFAIKRNLLQHLRNHNKESMTMYKCDECSIAFNTKRALKLHRFNEHKETVTDLNECDICNIPFVSVNDLNQHMNAIHDTINEKCEICMEHFTSKKLLEDHLLEHELMTVS